MRKNSKSMKKMRRISLFLLICMVVPLFMTFLPQAISPNSSEFNSDLSVPLENKQEAGLWSANNVTLEEVEDDSQEIVVKNLDDNINIKFNLIDLTFEDKIISADEIYQKLNILGGGHIADLGFPQLPTKSIYLDIPYDVDFEIEVLKSSSYQQDNIEIYPVQSSDLGDETPEPVLFKNETIYQMDTFYPFEIASLTEIGIIRAHRVALLTLFPVLYNPTQKAIKVYDEIELDIHYVYKDTISSKLHTAQINTEKYDSKAFEPFFNNLYSNFDSNQDSDKDGGLDRDSLDDGADYLIITPTQFCDNLVPLVNSKINQGISVKVANFSETGSTLSEIEAYIQNAYDTWDIPPSYLLLVGDSNILPTKTMEHYDGGDLATDLYYATVDGDDMFPDLFYGRLPVRTDAELNNIINKILDWVNNYNPSDTWRQTVLLSAYYQTGRYFVDTCESIRGHLETKGYTCNRVYAAEGTADPADTTAVINYINAGAFLVNHRNHGIADGWQRPELYTSHVSSLSNTNMYPVFISADCETGWFDEEADCLAEEILKAQNKGAVAYIGASRGSWSGFNDVLNKGFIDSIWPDYYSGYTNGAGQSAELGQVLNFGKLFMFDKYVLTGGAGYSWGDVLYPLKTQNTFEMFHLFGDPQLALIQNSTPSQPYNPSPSDASQGVTRNVELSVKVFDPNGDSMNVSFYNASDNSLIGVDLNVSNRRAASTLWPNLSKNTLYSWYANVTDGTSTIQSPTWEFTTRDVIEYSRSPIIINEVSTGTDYIELYNYGPDQDMTGWYLKFYDNNIYDITYYFPEGWTFHSNYVVTIHESTGTDSATDLYTGLNIYWQDRPAAVGLFDIETNHKDWFQTSTHTATPPNGVVWTQDITMSLNNQIAHRTDDDDTDCASDWSIASSGSAGSLNTGQTGTWNAPSLPTNPLPGNYTTKIGLNPTLSVDISHPDGKAMDVYFYNASDDALIDSDLGVSSGGTASISWSGLSYGTSYSWYVIIDDDSCNRLSPTWVFTTNYIPTADNPIPVNGSTRQILSPLLQVDVTDADGDSLDVYFYDASDDSLIDSALGVSSGSSALITWSGLSNGMEYEWYVIVDDGMVNYTSSNWSFTTNYAPTASDPSPPNSSTHQLDNTQLSIAVGDLDGDVLDVYFYNASDDSLIGVDTNVASATNASTNWSGLLYGKTYNWYVIVDDGITNTTSLEWSFTTNYVPTANNPTPSNTATRQYNNVTLGVDVDDMDLDILDIYFYNGSDDSLIDTDTSVNSGTTGSIQWKELAYGSTYYWYVVVDDGIINTTSSLWSFTTDNIPTYNSPIPVNESSHHILNPILSVEVNDLDGDNLDVSFYNASDDSLIDIDSNVLSGTNASVVWSGLRNGFEYHWYVVIDDGIANVTSGVWCFTTNFAPSAANPSPPSEAIHQLLTLSLQVQVTDGDGDILDVFFYNASDDSLIGTNSSVSSGNFASVSWSGLQTANDYYWYVIVDDGISNYTSPVWNFTTNYAPSASNPAPYDTETRTSFNNTLSVECSDVDGDPVNVYFFNATDDSLIGIEWFVLSGGRATINWIGISEGTTYFWYVITGDGISNSTSPTWSFIIMTNPEWIEAPTDQSLELGYDFYYDLNASDVSGIDSYSLNDTTFFSININGLITNITALNTGIYWIEVWATDPFNNNCTAVIEITVEDTTAPNWINYNTTLTVELGHSLSYDFNASDLSGIDHWWISDTSNFAIDPNGLLTNNTFLSIGLNFVMVQVYDPYSNYLSLNVQILVQDTTEPSPTESYIEKNIELYDEVNITVEVDDLSGIDHWWINDTINFQIDSLGCIQNQLPLTLGDYYLEVRVYDPYDNYCCIMIKITIQQPAEEENGESTPESDGLGEDPYFLLILLLIGALVSVLAITLVYSVYSRNKARKAEAPPSTNKKGATIKTTEDEEDKKEPECRKFTRIERIGRNKLLNLINSNKLIKPATANSPKAKNALEHVNIARKLLLKGNTLEAIEEMIKAVELGVPEPLYTQIGKFLLRFDEEGVQGEQ